MAGGRPLAGPSERSRSRLTGRSTSAENGLVERVPAVRGGDPGTDFVDHRPSCVTVGHDGDAVTLQAVRDQVALEAPVRAAVAEVPALAQLGHGETDGVVADTNRTE